MTGPEQDIRTRQEQEEKTNEIEQNFENTLKDFQTHIEENPNGLTEKVTDETLRALHNYFLENPDQALIFGGQIQSVLDNPDLTDDAKNSFNQLQKIANGRFFIQQDNPERQVTTEERNGSRIRVTDYVGDNGQKIRIDTNNQGGTSQTIIDGQRGNRSKVVNTQRDGEGNIINRTKSKETSDSFKEKERNNLLNIGELQPRKKEETATSNDIYNAINFSNNGQANFFEPYNIFKSGDTIRVQLKENGSPLKKDVFQNAFKELLGKANITQIDMQNYKFKGEKTDNGDVVTRLVFRVGPDSKKQVDNTQELNKFYEVNEYNKRQRISSGVSGREYGRVEGDNTLYARDESSGKMQKFDGKNWTEITEDPFVVVEEGQSNEIQEIDSSLTEIMDPEAQNQGIQESTTNSAETLTTELTADNVINKIEDTNLRDWNKNNENNKLDDIINLLNGDEGDQEIRSELSELLANGDMLGFQKEVKTDQDGKLGPNTLKNVMEYLGISPTRTLDITGAVETTREGGTQAHGIDTTSSDVEDFDDENPEDKNQGEELSENENQEMEQIKKRLDNVGKRLNFNGLGALEKQSRDYFVKQVSNIIKTEDLILKIDEEKINGLITHLKDKKIISDRGNGLDAILSVVSYDINYGDPTIGRRVGSEYEKARKAQNKKVEDIIKQYFKPTDFGLHINTDVGHLSP